MKNKHLFNGFKQYNKFLILGFVAGVISWIFAFTFESLQNQIANFWAKFFWFTFACINLVFYNFNSFIFYL